MMHVRGVGYAAAFGAYFFAVNALAQTQPGVAVGEAVETSADTPLSNLGDDRRLFHDKFYMRLGLGMAFYEGTLTQDSTGEESIARGMGPEFEIALGWAVVPGLVLAAGLAGTMISEPEVKKAGKKRTLDQQTMAQANYGLMVDYYPDPAGGFHLEGLLGRGSGGLADYSDTPEGNAQETKYNGIGGHVGIGYEFWTDDQWGMGLLGRVSAATMTEQDNEDLKLKVFIPVILLSGTMN